MTNRQQEPGYRGALPPRNDRMAAPWVVAVVAVFLLMIVLSFLGLPSAFVPAASATPLPSVAASESASASPAESGSAGASASPSAASSAGSSASSSATSSSGSAAPSATGSP